MKNDKKLLNKKQMTIPKFNNVPNERIQLRYTTNSGKQVDLDYFISRSVAVVGVVIASTLNGMYVLIAQRSKNMRDEALKFGVPCGYLDWNENAHEAMVREICEETSLHLPDFEKYIIFDNNKQPYCVKSSPSENHQNVSLLFVTVVDLYAEMQLFPYDIEKFTCHETSMVKWMPFVEFITNRKNIEWAFNHDETIMGALKHFNENYKANG
jgi:ADP-ribose pyrophosphatase YjhB (NUDIX family)